MFHIVILRTEYDKTYIILKQSICYINHIQTYNNSLIFITSG